MGRRIPRLNEQLKREISDILRFETRDPRIGLVTVTAVETAPDLTEARVHVRLPGDEEERHSALAGLRAAAVFIRGELARRLRIRRVPVLEFEVDRTLEHALHIERLLAEVAPPPQEPEEDTDEGGNGPATA